MIEAEMGVACLENPETESQAGAPPLPPSRIRRALPRETDLTREAQAQRLKILGDQGLRLPSVAGMHGIQDPAVFQSHIENFIGTIQMPLGLIGPLRIQGRQAQGDYYVPLATTEGALVASYNRGARLVTHSGGVRTASFAERMTRVPGFSFASLIQAQQFMHWCSLQTAAFQERAGSTTSHGRLLDVQANVQGNMVLLVLSFATGDAAGQNMVTLASQAVCEFILEASPVKPRFWTLECNYSGDKKASAFAYVNSRGKKVTAEAVIPRRMFRRSLHTEPEMMFEYWKMSYVAGVAAGCFGSHGHYANGLAALFIACGQDAACVAECAVGNTRIDITGEGALYISVTLPNLIVGTVGGGTHLPTQRECLSMLGCLGNGQAAHFAEICAATILAGELSIMGALAAGQFSQAHSQYGRKHRKLSAPES